MAKTISLSGQKKEEANHKDILTVEEFRAYKGCGHYSNEEAKSIIKSVVALASIIIASVCKKYIHIDNQHIVHLNQQDQAA